MNTLNKIRLILLAVILLPFSSNAQNYLDTICWVKITNPTLEAIEGEKFSANEQLNNLFNSFNVTFFEKALPFAKNPELLKLHEIRCNCDIDSLIMGLGTNFSSGVTSFSRYEISDTVTTYDPVDYMWYLTTQDPTNWLWHLKKTQTDLAWNITKGDASIKVAILDYGVDITHPDLASEIILPYDPYDLAPFGCNPSSHHGTSVASYAGAETTEQGNIANGQLASAGFKNKIVFYNANVTRQVFLQKALHASNIMGAKFITSCAGAGLFCTSDLASGEDLIVKEILDNGTSIIMPAGNGINGTHCGTNSPYNHHAFYPLNPEYDDRVIIVSGTDKNDMHYVFENGTEYTQSHFPEVDLCAPGHDLTGATPTSCGVNSWPYNGSQRGTSYATPITSSIASLVLSVNPCLGTRDLKSILKNTTDPIVDAANYTGLIGTGRINAFEAVKAAQAAYSATLDLFIKDRPEDFGASGGYDWQASRDESPDIWVRNQPDGLTNQIHQNPEYQLGQPVYVYVRVRNKSCVDATGTEQLKLYWSKAASWTSWPQNWDGSQPNIGDIIGTQNIGTLPAGQDIILEFTWNILNPYVFANWSTCLLARIENSAVDPITIHPSRIDEDVYFNNNIAIHNITIVDVVAGVEHIVVDGIRYPIGKYMFIGNPTDQEQTFDIEFTVPENDKGEPLTDVAEMEIIFDETAWQLIKDKVKLRTDIKVKRERVIIPIEKTIRVTNITFPPNTRVPVYVGFSFLTQKVTDKNEYRYNVNQYLSKDSFLLGGEHFIVRKQKRNQFNADAGPNKEILKNENATIHAADISESAIYNWYDPEGNLIYTGKDLSVSPQITKKYKLEIIANTDGFKDYDEIVVNVKQFTIDNVSPNPASNQVVVDYKADEASSAYLMVMDYTATTSYNYILDVNQTQTTFNVSNFQTGVYSVILVCDGVAVDMKSLIIQ